MLNTEKSDIFTDRAFHGSSQKSLRLFSVCVPLGPRILALLRNVINSLANSPDKAKPLISCYVYSAGVTRMYAFLVRQGQTKDKHAIRDNMKPRPFFSSYQPLLYLLEMFVLWEISKNWGTAVFVLILNSLVHFKNSSEEKGAMVPMKQIKVYNLTLNSFDDLRVRHLSAFSWNREEPIKLLKLNDSKAKSANDDALWIKCCRYFTVYSWRFS